MDRDSSLTVAHEGSLSPGEGSRQQRPFHLSVFIRLEQKPPHPSGLTKYKLVVLH